MFKLSIFNCSKTTEQSSFQKFKISNFKVYKFHVCFQISNFNFKIPNFKFASFRIIRLGFNFGVPQNIKLRRKRFHMKDTGKSSSRKLRRDVYYILYRMDPQKTHYKISCSATISNIQHFGFFFRFPPL